MKKKFIIIFIIIMSLILALFLYKNNFNFLKRNKKIVTIAVSSEPITLDPAYANNSEATKIIPNLYEGLVKYKDDSKDIKPALATSWDVDESKKEYTFHLRKGVKFHDGAKFNSYAVKENIERQLQKGEQKACFKKVFNDVAEFQVIDKYTIKFILSKKKPQFLRELANPCVASIVSPKAIKKYGDKLFNHPVGTGPFKFEKWSKGNSIIIKRNNEYWGEKCKVDKIIIKFINKNSQKVGKFLSKSVNIVDNLDSKSVIDIQKSGGKILEQKGENINYIKFNHLKSPFNDIKIRKTICESIDREEIIKKLYQGYATKIEDGIMYNIHGNIDELQKIREKNNIIKMIIYSSPTSYNNIGEKLAEFVQKDLLKREIRCTIEVVSLDKYDDKIKSGNWDIMFGGKVGDDILKKERDNLNKNIIFPICNSKFMAAYDDSIVNFKYHPTGILFLDKVDIK
ncbi:ABC transporter substrate-binding protein [Clostridium massiliodielmoense]|uniref:ABC transporter substrate-binding protein n=1 Tax=Clostridium massiliodielmoense TaxID=1776385 RepID=UPI0004D552AA|nr:ABC transporter substrate-binding protein [Clostridium massiliodielmoense]KEH98527.1 peptide ABC transporter substrate-binding protein [Clostridium botulinum C/D str. BKT12695]